MQNKIQKPIAKTAQKTRVSKKVIIYSIVLLFIVVLGTTIVSLNNKSSNKSENGDLTIQTKDISEKAKFYPLNIDGTKLEVLAVKAPDGSIRTAFNTCQVCYSSGRGYYVQQGDKLVCQNCKNQFAMSEVEVITGGCNPVPIKDKVVNEDTIVISKEFLKESKQIFANWKTNY